MVKKEQKSKKRNNREKELPKLPPEQQLRLDLYDWIQSLMVALVICVALFIFAVRVIDVSGSSMVPTLHDGDKMIVSNLFYKPKYGDIVVFKTDTYDPDRALVKRVIATEGQEISLDFDRGVVYINGSPIEEDYIAELTTTKLDFIGPQTVPEGCVFVMGDNRNASTDSRKKEIGMVDERMILGRAYYVVFPVSDMRPVQ
jgi:signal peptidase I